MMVSPRSPAVEVPATTVTSSLARCVHPHSVSPCDAISRGGVPRLRGAETPGTAARTIALNGRRLGVVDPGAPAGLDFANERCGVRAVRTRVT